MANKDLPNGFRPGSGVPYYPPNRWVVAGSEAIAVGDAVILNSAGRVALAASTSGAILGVAQTSVAATAAAGDNIWVWDNPDQIFEGQCSGSGALADPYTCATTATCFDIEGTTGIMEIDENATTEDVVKVIGIGKDPLTGLDSAVGANQRKLFVWNIHQMRRAATSVGV